MLVSPQDDKEVCAHKIKKEEEKCKTNAIHVNSARIRSI